MQFGIRKSGVVILKTGKVTRTDGTKLSDGRDIKNENGYAYLEIVATYKIKEKLKKKSQRSTYKDFKPKVPGKNRPWQSILGQCQC